jgi:hypothetical protein
LSEITATPDLDLVRGLEVRNVREAAATRDIDTAPLFAPRHPELRDQRTEGGDELVTEVFRTTASCTVPVHRKLPIETGAFAA